MNIDKVHIATDGLSQNFEWRDRAGKFHKPADMTTSHLFFTVRIIWNHTVPNELRITPYRKYTFDHDIYTTEYMKNAVYFLTKELHTRNDLTPHFQLCLNKIYDIVCKRRISDGMV